MYAGVYSLTISLLAVQFIYRYWVLFSIKHLVLFTGWKSLIWVFYCIFFAGNWWLGAYFLLYPDRISEDYFKEELLLRYNVLTSEIPLLTFLAFDPKDGSIRWRNVSYTIHVSGIMTIQYGIMMYCGWKMHSKMEEKLTNFSVALKHHHRQLFRTLVLQISTPTIFLFSPLLFVIYLPYFQLELSFPAGAAISAFSIYPAMDSTIVLIVVKEYRVVARRLWKAALENLVSEKLQQKKESHQPNQLSVSTL